MFVDAFPGAGDLISVGRIVKTIAAFERTVISGNSAFDRSQRGDSNAMIPAARRGEQQFFSERMECFHCPGGFNFTGTTDYVGKGMPEVEFHNTALYNVAGKFTPTPGETRSPAGVVDDMLTEVRRCRWS